MATATPVQPVVLRFSDPHGPFSLAVIFIGETTLLQSLWRVASAQSLAVSVELLPAVGTRHADRRALAAHLRALVAERLKV